MSKLKSVSLYDVYKLEGEDRVKALQALIDLYEAVQVMEQTYVGFADNAKNLEMLEEERKGYVEDKRKTEKFFDISLVAYTFIRFGLTIEAKLEEFNNEINSKLNEKESVG